MRCTHSAEDILHWNGELARTELLLVDEGFMRFYCRRGLVDVRRESYKSFVRVRGKIHRRPAGTPALHRHTDVWPPVRDRGTTVSDSGFRITEDG